MISLSSILTKPLNTKAVSPLELGKNLDCKYTLQNNYVDAVNEALSLPNEIIVITGSLYLVSDVLKFLGGNCDD